jgi:hypothetical protein
MKKSISFLSLMLFINGIFYAQVWHVSAGSGNDANDGKTSATAFRTLQHAADLVKPGDVVLIGDGIYTNNERQGGSAVLSIKSSGTKDAWITWKAVEGQHPEIHPAGWAGIQISGSYQIIDGITVIGGNDSIVLLKAQEDTKKQNADPHFNTNGIFVNGRGKKADEKPHHVSIKNCIVGKCPGGGIIAIEADYITIEDCKVYENAWYMRYGGSGISTLDNWAFDDAPGYHNIIQRNFCWNNKTMVAWEKIGRLSDGNGIILDVTDQEINGATNMNADKVIKPGDSTAKPKRPEWKGRSLVANNICAFNGGSGIHTFRTKYVDIINNTIYHNGEVVGYPDLFANSSEDIVFLNNIIVPRPGGKVTANNKNTNIKWDYNLSSIQQDFFKAPNDIVADPLFVNAYFDRLTADFHVKANSPALNSATDEVPQKTDIKGNSRPKGKGRDRGAYEEK